MRLLAEQGLLSGRYDLHDLAEWCWDWGIASGDSRYCVLWRVLGEVDQWWEDQGVPTRLLSEVDVALTSGLRDALDAELASSGAQFAHDLGLRLHAMMVPSDQWDSWL